MTDPRPICRNPDVLTDTTADFGFALLMAAARRITEGERYLRAGQWKDWRYDLLAGAEVHGSTLGIIGMGRIGQAVARVDGSVLVRGHTDNRPIRSARFPSNWHLSQARADAVAAALAPQLGARAQVKTEGSADSEPLMSNDTPDGRAQNRRVEIIVFPAAPRTRVE